MPSTRFRPRIFAGGATITVFPNLHTGGIILLDTAAGTTVTLPPATGSGAMIHCVVSVTATSNQHRVNVTGNDEFVGIIHQAADGGATANAYEALDTVDNDRIDLNGTTTGGIVGDWLTFVDITTDNWLVSGSVSSTGTEATPFATGQVT